MKVTLKGGSKKKNIEIEKFFMDKIFSTLKFGIEIEHSDAVIVVCKKKKDGTIERFINPTAEVFVGLTEEARNLAKEEYAAPTFLKVLSEDFYDEALAIQKIESLHPSFSVKYYSCYTSPSKEDSESECKVHGTIEHIQSLTGLCPGCGKLI